MKEVKYYWVQYIPLLGVLLIFLLYPKGRWGIDLHNKCCLGNSFDFFTSLIIQCITLILILLKIYPYIFDFTTIN